MWVSDLPQVGVRVILLTRLGEWGKPGETTTPGQFMVNNLHTYQEAKNDFCNKSGTAGYMHITSRGSTKTGQESIHDRQNPQACPVSKCGDTIFELLLSDYKGQ